MNPVKGTEILFLKDGVWYNKNSEGIIVPTNTIEYVNRYKLRDSLVVINDPSDNEYISSINGGEITVVVDKNAIGKPNLKTLEFTKEWMSLSHYLKLRKETAAFCHMAKNFNVPPKE